MEFTFYTWRLPKDLKAELDRAAMKDQTSISELLEAFTRTGLAQWQKDHDARRAEDLRHHVEALIAAGFKPKKPPAAPKRTPRKKQP